METLIEILHTMPLFVISFLFALPVISRLLFKTEIKIKSTESISLVLSAVGIAAGSNAHNAFHHLLDPCFGYAAFLLYIAAKISSSSFNSKKNLEA